MAFILFSFWYLGKIFCYIWTT